MPERTENDGQLEEAPSKSARKREMHHLQSVGEALLALSEQQLALMPLDDEQLLEAIRDCRKIRSNSARKRQIQFIGKLMRNIDAAPIEDALATLHGTKRQETAAFHQLEELREEILSQGLAGVELAMARFANADRQQLRQLILQHQRELQRNKPLAASRKLFRYLRELQENTGGSEQ